MQYSFIQKPLELCQVVAANARGNCLIECPLPNSSIEERKNYRPSKITCPELCHVASSENEEEKNLCESCTTLRNNSKKLEPLKWF